MLIKLKTTGKNLHQIVTLVVSWAAVRLISGETCTCRHACFSVYLCGCQMMSVCCVLFESVSCSRHHDARVFCVIV